jgi:[ribosomal protein S5]-alanine N-acetyltransferase|tara:strand:+ start:1776 stop:2258 length:483 start_codon:yes stop_codon:yes gene_type:complete
VNKKIFLRNLRYEDINKNYLKWFKNRITSKYIHSANKLLTLKELKRYFIQKKKLKKILFLAILNYKKKHIGNIKFEPINTQSKKIYMGILIGDKNYTNKGISKKVFEKVKNKFFKKFKKNKYYLIVDTSNKMAVKAYSNNNFKIIKKLKKQIEMVKYLWK